MLLENEAVRGWSGWIWFLDIVGSYVGVGGEGLWWGWVGKMLGYEWSNMGMGFRVGMYVVLCRCQMKGM